MNSMRIRKGDKVVVIAGKDKGKEGVVLRAIPTRQRVVVEGGQQQDPGAPAQGEDARGGGHPVQHGHLDVHEDDVDGARMDDVDGLGAVRGGGDDLDVRLGAECGRQDLPDDGVVVDDDDARRSRA